MVCRRTTVEDRSVELAWSWHKDGGRDEVVASQDGWRLRSQRMAFFGEFGLGFVSGNCSET